MDDLLHGLRLRRSRREKAQALFTQALRQHVAHDLAGALRRRYDALAATRRPSPSADGEAVHAALRHDETFKFYSALRVAAQDQVYQCIAAPVERERGRLESQARELAAGATFGSLTLDPGLAVPRAVSAIDVHLMPGSYTREDGAEDLAAGAVYDNRLQVTSMGLMGRNLDDIGRTAVEHLQRAYPDFRPRVVLDLGCTVGHNTGAWKDGYRDAEVHGVDVAAPCLRYALARARAQGRAIHFHQMNATALRFPAASFDVVFSSMFLHELPRRDIAAVFAEAHRVLRPGGLMLHMELPPNKSLAPFDQFYLDWDAHYNNEPFYKVYRDQDPRALCRGAGFPEERYFEWVLPSQSAIAGTGPTRAEQPAAGSRLDASVGRLSQGVRWFYFGAWR